MKTNSFYTKILVFLLCPGFIYSGCKNFSGNRTVIVSETRDKYQLAIDYNKDKTDSVEHYISSFVGQDAIFKPEHPSAINITMADKTTFNVKSTPGEFRLTFDKSKNSKTALDRVKRINEDLKPIIN
ncbi:hypothetical protein HDF26_002719 [Pedobacter cryoconitis]|uniref:hypothetical protein n=1 Tax=Pedobacter cryoconitis TaxID=188932 RepID=UPI00161D313D|nr:hypothetical protein [Pedobacter cryoconitis]MBB6272262.1 hypothetical protein [Pedobacter cryoconitis]